MRHDVSYFTVRGHDYKPGDRFFSHWDGAEFRVSALYADFRFSAVPWTWWDSLKGLWDHVYGKKSHMNLAGKILVGIPMFPFVVGFCGTWMLLDFLFTKKTKP